VWLGESLTDTVSAVAGHIHAIHTDTAVRPGRVLADLSTRTHRVSQRTLLNVCTISNQV